MNQPKPGHRQTALTDLTLHPQNPRHGDIGVIVESIEQNGWIGSLVAQCSTGHVLAGNHRMQAAAHCGFKKLPTHWIDCDDAAALRILLSDNRTSDLATNDDDILAELLTALVDTEDGLVGTGYDGDDLDDILESLAFDDTPDDTDEPPPPIEQLKKTTKPGDVWILGDHRLMCGDSRDADHVTRLLDGAAINLGFTSPPYADRRKYDEDSGFNPIPPDEYVEWFRPVADNVKTHLDDDGSWFVNIKASVVPDGDSMELYVMDLVLAHARDWGWNLATEFCWERAGMPKSVSRRFKNQFEPIYQFAQGRWKMRPDAVKHASDNVPVAMGPGAGDTSWANDHGGGVPLLPPIRKRKHGSAEFMSDMQGVNAAPGEYITEGMAYPGNRLPTFTATHEATGHAAAFPVGLPQFFIMAYTDEGDTVYDPFIGSGSTILAANNTGRIGYGMELSPAYCDIICNRYQRHTNTTPILERTGKPVDFVTA